MLTPPQPPAPRSASPSCQQPICLNAVLVSGQALFRLVALLHRKHLQVRALIVQPRTAPTRGHRLRLAVLPGNTPTAHVIELIRGIVGISGVRLAVPARRSGDLPRHCRIFLLNGSAHPIRALRPTRGSRSPVPDRALSGAAG